MSGPMQWIQGRGLVPAFQLGASGAIAQSPDDDDADEDDEVEQPVVSPARPAVPRPVAKPRKSAEPINVVKLASARLREVESELRRMKKLETERMELRRLLDAAKPLAPVRALPKRSAG